jgi:DMSO/TMAO reductase YedYZ molybdopterin-dependent catalytic subunit
MSPPAGPLRASFWRSPLRGPWLTALLGVLLLPLLLVVAATGLLSHAAYNPQLGHNAVIPGAFQPLVFDWPTRPSWLYALNQSLHVTVGIVAVPLLLAKLWSVIPRLWTWPPLRSPAHALERLGLLILVGSAAFQFATGIVNAQLYYPFHFGFVRAHYYGGWVFIAALVLHVALKLPTIARAYRAHGALRPLRADLAATRPERYEPGGLAPPTPATPTMSRRGLLGLVGGGMGALLVVTAGQSIGGPLRHVALLAPRGRVFGTGPNDFQVNITASFAGIDPTLTGVSWRLQLRGARVAELSREQLLALPQHTHDLPIACVEGWTTTQRWTGVRLADLAALAGSPRAGEVLVQSLEERGTFRQVTLSRDQLNDPRSLLALRVNGADLSLDHGFPARIIVPAAPGVHCTKWVASMELRA